MITVSLALKDIVVHLTDNVDLTALSPEEAIAILKKGMPSCHLASKSLLKMESLQLPRKKQVHKQKHDTAPY